MKKNREIPKILPLGDRVLVKPYTEDELKGDKKRFGIIIPDSVSKEKSAQGKVIAVGPGRHTEDGKLIPVNVKEGSIVIFSKYSFDEVELDGTEYYLIKEDNILAVIKR